MEIFDAPKETSGFPSLGGGGSSALPSLGGFPAMNAPKSTGLALFDEIEIKENDTAEEAEVKQ